MRSNSDAVAPNFPLREAVSPKKTVVAKKAVPAKNPKDELESLMRQGPKGDVQLALQNLRHWILCDGMDADSDGMVGYPKEE